MLSTEFLEVFESFPNFKNLYQGCYSADNLPKKLKTPKFAIINTDISTGIGKHWYVALRSSNKLLEIFDSLGIDSEKKSFLKNNLQIQGVKEIEFNITQFQKNDTNTCGKFALYFIINRLFNMDYCFSDFLEEIFEEDLNKNEEKVNEFYNELSQNFSDSEML